MYKWLFVCSGLFCFAASAAPLTQIDPVTTAELSSYLTNTAYIDFSNYGEFDFGTLSPLYGSVEDFDVTAAFSVTGGKFTVPTTWGDEWAGGSPYLEGQSCTGGCSQLGYAGPGGVSTLPVIWGFLDKADPMTISLSGDPVMTFGFEVGGTIGSTTAVFYGVSGDTLTITFDMTNPLGTQSFIYAATGEQITKVSLTTTDVSGPAIGAFRYELAAVPEPATFILLGAGMLALGTMRRLRAGKAA